MHPFADGPTQGALKQLTSTKESLSTIISYL